MHRAQPRFSKTYLYCLCTETLSNLSFQSYLRVEISQLLADAANRLINWMDLRTMYRIAWKIEVVVNKARQVERVRLKLQPTFTPPKISLLSSSSLPRGISWLVQEELPRLLLFLELSWKALSAVWLVHDVVEVRCGGWEVENDEVAATTSEEEVFLKYFYRHPIYWCYSMNFVVYSALMELLPRIYCSLQHSLILVTSFVLWVINAIILVITSKRKATTAWRKVILVTLFWLRWVVMKQIMLG